jgi:SulP family sulfate permease
VVVLIVAVMGTVGYIEGVGFGVLAAVFLFIHNYSRVGVITHSLTGVELQSNVDRPVAHQRLLQQEGGGLHLLKLQGFIFFGTANTLLSSIRARVADRSLPPLKCVILDFRRVSGLDSSAALSLTKAGQFARKVGFELLLTQVPESTQSHLRRGAIREDKSEALRFFPDVDHALEWWESRALAEHGVNGQWEHVGLRDQLKQYWPDSSTLDVFLSRLQRRVLEEGQYLIRHGAFADELYFIESGEVSTLLDSGDGSPARRLRRQGGGTVLGELGLLLKLPRSASVIVNRTVVVYCLTDASLQQLKHEHPEVAADFYEFLSCFLAERVVNTTKSLRVLTD